MLPYFYFSSFLNSWHFVLRANFLFFHSLCFAEVCRLQPNLLLRWMKSEGGCYNNDESDDGASSATEESGQFS
jgi:hypothetical protein